MDAVWIIAAAVASIWAAVLFVRGGLLAGGLITLLAGTCFGFYFYHLPTKPIPLTADRVLWLGLMAQGLVWWRLGWSDPKRPTRGDAVLAALLVVLAASTMTHDWRVGGAQPLSRLLFYYVMPVGMYWVGRQAILGRRSITWLLGWLVVFGVYLSATATAEMLQLWWAVFPKYIASTSSVEFLGRGRGPVMNPAGCGLLQGLCLAAALVLLPSAGRRGKVVLVAACLVMGAGIYSTLTRSAWLGAGLGVITVAVLMLPRRLRLAVPAACVLAATLLAATQWHNLLEFKRDKELSARETAESAKLRPILATVAWKMFVARPVWGCGFGHYDEEHLNFLSDRNTELPLEKARPFIQHNVVLSLLVETGMIGAALFALLMALWGREAWLVCRSASPPWARQYAVLFLAGLANYLVNGMFHDVSIMPMIHMVLFFLAGIMVGVRQTVAGGRP